jgi:hypothetical protein
MKKRKPVLTEQILRGVIAGLAVHEAADVDDMCGGHSPEQMKDYDNAMDALNWAREMINWRALPAPVRKGE